MIDISSTKEESEVSTPQLEIINMDPSDLEAERKTDEPLFVRVGYVMYTTFLKDAKIKMFAYNAIDHDHKKFDPKGKQVVDDYGSIYMLMKTGTAMTRPEMKFSLEIDGDPTQQRELTNKLIKAYYKNENERKLHELLKQSNPSTAILT